MSRRTSFWDRRRAAVRAEEAEELATQPAEVAEDLRSDDEILAELNLPDPDSLMPGDDFAGFMAKAVPQHLRNRALRRLWRSNPVLGCVDGLNDYDQDFLSGSTGNGPIRTAYRVGQGMLSHLQELERRAEPAEPREATDAAQVAAAAVEEEPVAAEEALQETIAFKASDDEDGDHTPAPRRMRFHFEDDTA